MKLDFYTPVKQIAHCGHATIATFAYLKQIGKIKDQAKSSKETIDGVRQIKFVANNVFMEQQAPVFTYPTGSDQKFIYASLGLSEKAVPLPPALVYTGNRFMVLEVESENVLKSLNLDFDVISEISRKYDLVGYYVFARISKADIDAAARMFAPAYGITEESATGMAAGPLAAFLYKYHDQKKEYLIQQGSFMDQPSPSLIKVMLNLKDQQITSLYAGGAAALMKKIEIEV